MTREEFENKDLDELCVQLEEEGNTITSYDTLKGFAKECIDDDNLFLARHILDAIDSDTADYYFYDYCMGTMETPSPITSKEDIEDCIEEDK